MTWMRQMMLAFALCGLVIGAGATAQTEEKAGDTTIEDLRKGQAELQAEVDALKTEVQAARADLQKILREIQVLKTAQKTTPTPPQRNPRPVDTTVYDINVGSSPVRGAKDAPVTIVEFADFQCPFCIREWPKLDQMLKENADKVRVVFKHFPLNMHKKAKPIHAAAALAQKQKGSEGFWQFHDLVIANPKAIEISDLRSHAEKIGMDLEEFDRVMADEKEIDALLAADMAEAQKVGVRGTPTVLINGLKMAKRDLADYKARIDEVLGKKGEPSAEQAVAPPIEVRRLVPGEQPSKPEKQQ